MLTVESPRVGGNILKYQPDWRSVSTPVNCTHIGKINGAVPLKVISYNILRDGNRGAMGDIHDYCSEEFRVWKDPHYSNSTYNTTQRNLRLHRVVQRLLELDADIICLYEAGKDFLHDFMSMQEISLICDDIERSVRFSDLYSGYHVADSLTKEDEMSINRPVEMENLILVRNELIKNGTIEILKVQSFLYKNNLAKGRFTENNKKLFSNREETCIFMRVMVNISLPEVNCDNNFAAINTNNDTISNINVLQNTLKRVPLLIGSTHFLWDPHYPHVKAIMAELFANLGAQEAHDFIRENDLDDDHVNIIFCGDFNTVCHFQPRYCLDEEKEVINGEIIPLLSNDNFRQLRISPGIDAVKPTGEANQIYCFFPNLQPESSSLVTTPNMYSLSQCVLSGAFQLYACGTLPSYHPEHPDSFRKTAQQLEMGNNCKKQSSGMGSMFIATGPLKHAYSSHPLAKTSSYPDFVGWVDHIWYSTYDVTKLSYESVQNSLNKEDQEKGEKKEEPFLVNEVTSSNSSFSIAGGKGPYSFMTQTGYLKTTGENLYLFPNSHEPSDHLPVGAIFCFSTL